MAADSDGILTAVVICEGNLHDPDFPNKFRTLLGKLKIILQQPKSKKLKVNKVEPWNSVRVTLSIPKDAAQKLRQLASEGNNALRALGILSVQLEGDSVISLRIAGHEIVLRTDNTAGYSQEAGPSSDNTSDLADLSRILGNPLQSVVASNSSSITQTASTSDNKKVNVNESSVNLQHPQVEKNIGVVSVGSQSLTNNARENMSTSKRYDKLPIFKSPNTICPMDEKLPTPPVATNIAEVREYPFESMTQARVIQRRQNTLAALNQQPVPIQQSSQHLIGINTNLALGPPGGCPPVPQKLLHNKSRILHSSKDVSSEKLNYKTEFIQPPPPPYLSPTIKTQKTSQQIGNVSGNNIAISSPLLVNLLQNDVSASSTHSKNVSSISRVVQNTTDHLRNKTSLDNMIDKSQDPTLTQISISPKSQSLNSNSNNILHNPSTVYSKIPTTPMSVPSSNFMNLRNIDQSSHSSAQSASNVQISTNLFQGNVGNHNLNHNTNARLQLPLHGRAQQHNQQSMLPCTISETVPRYSQQNLNKLMQTSVHPGNLKKILTTPQSSHPNNFNTENQRNITTSFLPKTTQLKTVSHATTAVNYESEPYSGHTRWPFKPMDSVTKSSFQEFTRYQMQYNLQQEINQQQQSSTICTEVTSLHPNLESDASQIKQAEALAPANLCDLDELTKNDLDALLPSINCDLDADLSAEDKNALESLLQDANDLDLDLIDPALSTVNPNLLDVTLGCIDAIGNLPSEDQLQLQLLAVDKADSCKPVSTNNSINKKLFSQIRTRGPSKQMLINPLTGELEPMPTEESDGDQETQQTADSKTLQEFCLEKSNSFNCSDEDTSCSTAFSKNSELSDTDKLRDSNNLNRSLFPNNGGNDFCVNNGACTDLGNPNKKIKLNVKNVKTREKFPQDTTEKVRLKVHREKKVKAVPPKSNLDKEPNSSTEKIKLRLKLEKVEPISPAYKVDVSFVETQNPPVNASASLLCNTSNHINATSKPVQQPIAVQNADNISLTSALNGNMHQSISTGEELRVPPLHISLRGKNSIIIKNSRKEKKKSQSIDDEDIKRNNIKRSHNHLEESQHNEYEDLYTANSPLQSSEGKPQAVSKLLNSLPRPRQTIDNKIDKSMNNEEKSQITFPAYETSANDPSLSVLRSFSSEQMTSDNKKIKLNHDFMVRTSVSNLKDKANNSYLNRSSTTNQESCNQLDKSVSASDNNKRLNVSLVSLNSYKTPISCVQKIKVIQSKDDKNNPFFLPQGDKTVIKEETCKPTFLEENIFKGEKTTTSVPSVINTEPKTTHLQQLVSRVEDSANTNQESDLSSELNVDMCLEMKSDVSVKTKDNISKSYDEFNNYIDQKLESNIDIAPILVNNALSVNIRNSPSSQVQGEDSGIESMDALSEKSPHQTASPQQSDLLHLNNRPKTQSNAPCSSHKTIKPIEKMSQSSKNNSDTNCNIANVIKVEPNVVPKLDGVVEPIIPTKTEPATSGNSKTHPLVYEKNEILTYKSEKHLVCTQIEKEMQNQLKSEANIIQDDLNENKIDTKNIKSQTSLKTIVNCCKANMNPVIKLENITDIKMFSVDSLRIPHGEHVEKTDVTTDAYNANDCGPITNQDKQYLPEACEITESNVNNDIMAPISIEIPNHADIDSSRIRTRASSKLESPLDLKQNQSPNLDSPVNSSKNLSKLPTSVNCERLSPKACSLKPNNQTINSCITGTKRKIQCSPSEESQMSLGASDKKRFRTNSGSEKEVTGPATEISISCTDTINIKPKVIKKNSGMPLEGIEKIKTENKHNESSDSDEPLIEVAGKVRSIKPTKSGFEDKMVRNSRTVHKSPTLVSVPNAKSNKPSVNCSSTTACILQPSSSNNSTAIHLTRAASIHSNNSNEEKIGTRRSVRANASYTKVIANKGSQGTDNKVNSTKTGTSELVDVRRKTRSAFTGEITFSEGRRRRTSKDSK